jgi:hypothetical protein
MTEKIYPYQFANLPPFKRLDMDWNYEIGYKTQFDDNSFGNGTTRSNGDTANFRSDYILPVTFIFQDDQTFNQLLKYADGKQYILYFVRQDENGNITFQYNIAEILGVPRSWTQNEPYGPNAKLCSCKFRLATPRRIACDNDLKYIDYTNAKEYRYDTGLTYDSGLIYDAFELTSEFFVSSLSNEQKLAYFGVSNPLPTVKLAYPNKWLKRETTGRVLNNFLQTEDFSSNIWAKTNCTVNLNSNFGTSGNIDATLLTTSAGLPSISQSNIVIANNSIKASINVKIISGNVTHVRCIATNTTDGSLNSSQVAIVNSTSLGNSWYNLSFSFTTTQDNGLTIKFEFSNNGSNPTTGSTILIEHPQVFNTLVSGAKPTYMPVINMYDDFCNFQNAFCYTLTSNDIQVSLNTSPLNLQTTIINNDLAIEFEPLNQNEWFEIINSSNNTGFRLTWLSTTPSNNCLYYPISDTIFDIQNKQVIDVSNYRIDSLPFKFYLSKLYPDFESFDYLTGDNLKIQKSTSQNLTILMQNLKQFL